MPTRDRILTEAERLFAARGFAGTSLRQVADAVGVTPPNLYNHFRSKRALYESVLDRGIAPLMEILGRSQAENWSEPATVRMLEDVFSYLDRTPHLPRLVYFEMLTGGADLQRIAESWIRPLLVTAVAALEEQGDANSADTGVWDVDELPLLVSAWFNLVCGHFVTRELIRESLGEDAAASDVRNQIRFFIRLWRRIAPAPLAAGPRAIDVPNCDTRDDTHNDPEHDTPHDSKNTKQETS
jgi:AcrR family transcriptional regulator